MTLTLSVAHQQWNLKDLLSFGKDHSRLTISDIDRLLVPLTARHSVL